MNTNKKNMIGKLFKYVGAVDSIQFFFFKEIHLRYSIYKTQNFLELHFIFRQSPKGKYIF